MKPNRLRWFLLFLLLGAVFQLPAQQSEADRKLLADLRARAEKGDTQSQFELGNAFYKGSFGFAKDCVEAVRWFRKAAEHGHVAAQAELGECYYYGVGVTNDYVEAVKWFRTAAEQNNAKSQRNLGFSYFSGNGVPQSFLEAAKCFRKAAEQNDVSALTQLAVIYSQGLGVEENLDKAETLNWEAYTKSKEPEDSVLAQYQLWLFARVCAERSNEERRAIKIFKKLAEDGFSQAQTELGTRYVEGKLLSQDYAEAAKWFRKAAHQNDDSAQYNLGVFYENGEGVPRDFVEAYKWMLLAEAQGNASAKAAVTMLERKMTPQQIAEGQKMARNFKPRQVPSPGSDTSAASIEQTRPESSGTGFFITDDGCLITNEHVAGNGAQVRLVTSAGLISARVVKVDAANDLALLKATGTFTALPIASSRTMHLGSTVATVGFPNIGLQGFAPKLAKGEIAALSGAEDDPRYFQISVPVQPGNSGGALVDERGNVVGVVAAKLSAQAALATSGALPENVNYAVKSSFLLSFLESVPDVSPKLKEPSTKECRFEDVVKSAEKAAVLVLVY